MRVSPRRATIRRETMTDERTAADEKAMRQHALTGPLLPIPLTWAFFHFVGNPISNALGLGDAEWWNITIVYFIIGGAIISTLQKDRARERAAYGVKK